MSEDLKIRQIALARVLLDDITLCRLPSQPLLIKTRRLARLVHAEETLKWLGWEMSGYPTDDDLAWKYLDRTGRLTDKKRLAFYSQPLSEIDQLIVEMQAELRRTQPPNDRLQTPGSGPPESTGGSPGANGGNKTVGVQLLSVGGRFEGELDRLIGIRARIESMLHEFVGATYCTLVFRRLIETIFDKHHAWVDTLLGDGVGDALQEIPAIYHKLSAANRQGIIQALERVWNCQPLAWRPDRLELRPACESAQVSPEPQVDQEQILFEFNRVIRELLRVKVNRNTVRRSKTDLLLDIRKSARENLLHRPQKTVRRPMERAARTA